MFVSVKMLLLVTQFRGPFGHMSMVFMVNLLSENEQFTARTYTVVKSEFGQQL